MIPAGVQGAVQRARGRRQQWEVTAMGDETETPAEGAGPEEPAHILWPLLTPAMLEELRPEVPRSPSRAEPYRLAEESQPERPSRALISYVAAAQAYRPWMLSGLRSLDADLAAFADAYDARVQHLGDEQADLSAEQMDDLAESFGHSRAWAYTQRDRLRVFFLGCEATLRVVMSAPPPQEPP